MTNTIQIGRLEYSIEITERHGEKAYILRGKRGARYITKRNVNHPAMMFLVDDRGFGIPQAFMGVWFTDAAGEFVVVGR